jgi:two-component system, OmpR family, response regulator QseB
MRLLLVEDDPMIGEAVRTGLRHAGFTVDWVRDGAAALSACATEPFELILLDLGLPRRDGTDVLRTLRRQDRRMPVIIITARDGVEDRIAGLNAGADDYIVKPFDVAELIARIRAVARRHHGQAISVLRAGAITLDPVTREVSVEDKPVVLSGREFSLLELLMRRPGVAWSRSQIEERLFGWGEEVESNAVEVYIHGLRRKLGAQAIQNIRGVGWLVPKR